MSIYYDHPINSFVRIVREDRIHEHQPNTPGYGEVHRVIGHDDDHIEYRVYTLIDAHGKQRIRYGYKLEQYSGIESEAEEL